MYLLEYLIFERKFYCIFLGWKTKATQKYTQIILQFKCVNAKVSKETGEFCVIVKIKNNFITLNDSVNEKLE